MVEEEMIPRLPGTLIVVQVTADMHRFAGSSAFGNVVTACLSREGALEALVLSP